MTGGPALDLARDLFDRLARQSHDGVGITRDTYGPGEQAAHDLIRSEAERLGLEVGTDAALNLYVTLPGVDRSAPKIMVGSHLDSVPRGGNFDGAAGVLAGLAVLEGWRAGGFLPLADTVLIVIRAEESAWFPLSYIGSKAAFGRLDAEALRVCRGDTGRSLAAHLTDLAGDPDAVARGEAALDPTRIARFIEVHIEQGPVLMEADQPVGLVTGIRGSFRYRSATITGAYAHSGATPRDVRRDAVLAVARIVTEMDAVWTRRSNEGHDLVITFGRVCTDPEEADFSKVAGYVSFCVDVRSEDAETLALLDADIQAVVDRVARKGSVAIDLGPRTGSRPARMDPALIEAIRSESVALGIPVREMPCGAGHDAAVFAQEGVPTAMLFIRNANGSHNPREAMDFDDFSAATRLLERALALPTPASERIRDA
jgi:N-carbamoyl-L-amino-acid hydrolase